MAAGVASVKNMRNSILMGILLLLEALPARATPCSATTPEQAAATFAIAQTDSRRPARVSNPASGAPVRSRYRVRRILIDAALSKRWAMVEDCAHPGRPLQMVAIEGNLADVAPDRTRPQTAAAKLPAKPVSASGSIQGPVQPSTAERRNQTRALANFNIPGGNPPQTLVRAGDRVYLWSIGDSVRLKIEATAVEYGRAGQVIHLRRAGQKELLAGVVMGPDSAELMP